MFSRKQLLLIGFVMIFSCFQLDAVRIVNFANKTQEPKLDDSNLDFTLVNEDGKKFNVGTFKSSIDLDQYEISKNKPVKLMVAGLNLPSNVTNKRPSVISEILKPGTTYSITTKSLADSSSPPSGYPPQPSIKVYLHIDPVKK